MLVGTLHIAVKGEVMTSPREPLEKRHDTTAMGTLPSSLVYLFASSGGNKRLGETTLEHLKTS